MKATTPTAPVLVGNALSALRRARETARKTESEEEVFQFFDFVLPRIHNACGQLFQDLWVLWETGSKRDGFFVEFGVANGVWLSNTYLLEKELGWRGVIAEPNPVFFESIRQNRSCYISEKCVFSRSGESIRFLPAKEGEKSRIASIVPDDAHERLGARIATEISVETVSLSDLLIEAKAPSDIDYLSVDTEGSEYEILSAFDFNRWNVRLISAEHNRTSSRERVHHLLASNGYIRKWSELSAFDDWYVRS